MESRQARSHDLVTISTTWVALDPAPLFIMNLVTCNLRQFFSVLFEPAIPLPMSTSTTSMHIPTEVISEIIDDLENMHIRTEPISPGMNAHWMSHYPSDEREAHSRKLRDLLACRLVSRAFMDVCTPRVFKLVRITQNQWRINAFRTLFGDEEQNLRGHVRELIYKDGNDEQQTAGNESKPTLLTIQPNYLNYLQ